MKGEKITQLKKLHKIVTKNGDKIKLILDFDDRLLEYYFIFHDGKIVNEKICEIKLPNIQNVEYFICAVIAKEGQTSKFVN